MKKSLTVLLGLLIAGGCMPEGQSNPTNPIANNPLEINAPDGFNWSTTSTVSVSMDKLFIPVSLVRTLEVRDDAGTVYFKGTHDLTSDFSLSVSVPNHIKSLTMQTGEVIMKESITANHCLFTFPVIELSTD